MTAASCSGPKRGVIALAITCIREAERSDSERVYEIVTSCLREVYPSYYTSEECSEWIEAQSPDKFAKVVEEGGVVVAEGVLADDVRGENQTAVVLGFGRLGRISNSDDAASPYPNGYEMEVKLLYVDPAAHRRGVGRSLMKEMESRAGCDRLGVVASLNAISFYESLGFRVVGDHAHSISPGGTQVETKVLVKDGLSSSYQ